MYKELICGCLCLVFISEKAVGMNNIFYEDMITNANKMEDTIKNMNSIPFRDLPELKDINAIVTNLSYQVAKLKTKLQEIGKMNAITPEEAGNIVITPEEAGDIVRQIALKDSLLLFDESSSQSLIKSFKNIGKILKEENNNSMLQEQLTTLQRIALQKVTECFANACPGELTYSFDDDEQYEIICAAQKTYTEVR